MNNTTQRRLPPESKTGPGFLKIPSFTCARAILALATVAGLLTTPVARGADPVRPLQLACDTAFAFNATGAIDITGSCHYSHLGLTKAVASQIVTVLPDGSLQIVNTSVYTAANGDELFATVLGNGHFTPGGVTFSGVETYTGGTGRFDHASGTATISGAATFTTPISGTGHFSGSGTISY